MKRAKIFAVVIYGMLVMGAIAFVHYPELQADEAQAKIGRDQAREVALRAVPGTIKDSDLETEHGRLVYSFEIAPLAQRGSFEIAPLAQRGSFEIAPLAQCGSFEIAPLAQRGSFEIAPLAQRGSFEIARPGQRGIVEVNVSAMDGSIVDVHREHASSRRTRANNVRKAQ